MTDEIEVCPECDSSSLYNNNPDAYRGSGEAKRYGCYDCKATFDVPPKRDRKPGGGRRHGLASRLAGADPDDVTAEKARRDEPDAAIRNRGSA